MINIDNPHQLSYQTPEASQPTSSGFSLEGLAKMVEVALNHTQELGYQSYRFVSERDLTTEESAAHLDVMITNSHPTRGQDYDAANVFGPMADDPEAASQKGTEFLAELEEFIIIKDLYPAAKTHFLVIPKNHYEALPDMPADQIAKMYQLAIKTAEEQLGLTKYRLTANVYPPNQQVPHVHLHIMSDQSATLAK